MNSATKYTPNESIFFNEGLQGQKPLHFVQQVVVGKESNKNHAPGFQYVSMITNAATQA